MDVNIVDYHAAAVALPHTVVHGGSGDSACLRVRVSVGQGIGGTADRRSGKNAIRQIKKAIFVS